MVNQNANANNAAGNGNNNQGGNNQPVMFPQPAQYYANQLQQVQAAVQNINNNAPPLPPAAPPAAPPGAPPPPAPNAGQHIPAPPAGATKPQQIKTWMTPVFMFWGRRRRCHRVR